MNPNGNGTHQDQAQAALQVLIDNMNKMKLTNNITYPFFAFIVTCEMDGRLSSIHKKWLYGTLLRIIRSHSLQILAGITEEEEFRSYLRTEIIRYGWKEFPK